MTASGILRAAVLGVATLAAVAGCGNTSGGGNSASAPLRGTAFDSDPCGAYSFKTLAAVVQPVLSSAGWPEVGPASATTPPDARLSAQVQRCRYPLAMADPDRYGDQAITITVYDEMSNGRALMDTCESRGATTAGTPSPDPATRPLGDESCLDVDGQWRFRVADRYVSVSVDIPPRTSGTGGVVSSANTSTYVAPDDPRTRADVSRAVAENLALRLRQGYRS